MRIGNLNLNSSYKNKLRNAIGFESQSIWLFYYIFFFIKLYYVIYFRKHIFKIFFFKTPLIGMTNLAVKIIHLSANSNSFSISSS